MERPSPQSILYGQVRAGRVSSVSKDKHTAQVQFFEVDGMVSFDLPVLVPFGGDYCLPAKDTPVLCLLMDGSDGQGYVLGAFYTESDAPPLSDAGQRSIKGDDLRLGAPDASDEVALAPPTNDGLTALWDVLDGVCGDSAPPVNEAGNGGPSSLQAAFKAAIAAQKLANKLPPADVAAENVKAK